jgi:hypothetical protein
MTTNKFDERQRADWRNLNDAIAKIRRAFPDAKSAQFQTSDQDTYGFTLYDVIGADDSPVSAENGAWDALLDDVNNSVGDINWDDVMEEDEGGFAEIDLAVNRPSQRFRIIRGASTNYKVVYYHDKATRNARAATFAAQDGDLVLCEIWSQDTAVNADPINGGWALDDSIGTPKGERTGG